VVLPDPQTVHCLADLEPRHQGSGLLLVPLFAAGNPEGQELLGGIALMRHPQPGSLMPRPWQPEDLELAEAVAEQAAMAIGQARLLKQTQHLLAQTRQQAEQASLLNRMTDRIRHSLDLDEILQSAVEEVGQALRACRAQFVFLIRLRKRVFFAMPTPNRASIAGEADASPSALTRLPPT
jgi:GAF domain-containing protein